MAEQRPTDQAKSSFGRAKSHGRLAHIEGSKNVGSDAMYKSHMALTVHDLAEGMEALTTGLRATYLLLEEVKRTLEQRR